MGAVTLLGQSSAATTNSNGVVIGTASITGSSVTLMGQLPNVPTSSGTSYRALQVGYNNDTTTIIARSGNVTISATTGSDTGANYDSTGIFRGTSISAVNGSVTIRAVGGSSADVALYFDTGVPISASGTVSISGTGTSAAFFGLRMGATIGGSGLTTPSAVVISGNQVSVNGPITAAGSVSITSGDSFTLTVPIVDTVASGSTGSVSLIAANDITLQSNITGSGAGTVNVLLSAAKSGTEGAITASGGQTITATGSVTLGGGTAGDGSGYALGTGIGIYFTGGASISAGGAVTLRGQSNGQSSANDGVEIGTASITGSSVTLIGAAPTILNNYEGGGVYLSPSNVATHVTASSGNVVIQGSEGGGNDGYGHVGVLIGGGGVISAPNGSATITGTVAGGNSANLGIQYFGGAQIGAGQTVTLSGTVASTAQTAIYDYGSIGGGSLATPAAVSVQSNGSSLTLAGSITAAGTVSVTSSGALTVTAPIVDTVTSGTGSVSLIAANDITLQSNITGSGAGTANVLLSAAKSGSEGVVSISGPTITTTGSVTIGGGTAGDGSGYAIGTSGAAGILIGGGAITAGGAVTLHGQSTGFDGINLSGDSISGGSVVLTGVAAMTGGENIGTLLGAASNSTAIKATSGNVTINGTVTGTAYGSNHQEGVFAETGSISAPNGSITINGTGAPGSTSLGYGVYVSNATLSASGTIGLSGTSSTSVASVLVNGAIGGGSLLTPAAVTIQGTGGPVYVGSITAAGTVSVTSSGSLTISAPILDTVASGSTGSISLVAANDITLQSNIAGVGGGHRQRAGERCQERHRGGDLRGRRPDDQHHRQRDPWRRHGRRRQRLCDQPGGGHLP